MKAPSLIRRIASIFAIAACAWTSLVGAQYYFFDAPSASNYPYQQWCSEQLLIKATTENNLTGATAGLLRLQFDPTHFSYFTWDTAADIQTNLFNASAATFFQYTNPTMSPTWIAGSNHTILWIDRINGGTAFKGTWLYGTLFFVPVYSPSTYTWFFSFVYDGDTIKTSLSYAGSNIINPAHQNSAITWQFFVAQQPCVDDTTAPATSIVIPSAGTKKSHLSGVHLSLTDTVWDTNVPYVRTGDLPNLGTWTGNDRWLNNQYGIHLSTFNIRISGNGTGRYYSGSMFSSAGDLAAVASGKTRQFRDRNYAIDIDPSMIFDFGIEKPITISGNVRDRNNNLASFTRTVNAPVSPRLIAGSATPAANASAVLATDPITLGIADDRAGVNSWSITVTLSGVNGTDYGPYTFSGTSLNLSGIIGSALQPDYSITIDNHVDFPTSWTIHVHVYALDMAGTTDAINDYTFTTKPSCLDLGCCDALYIQTWTNLPFLYTPSFLTVSGWFNPSFTIYGLTGVLDCGTAGMGMNIYKWTEQNSWSATHLSFFDLPQLIFSWYNDIKAVLSWTTVYLQSTHTFTFEVKAFPSNRVYQATNNANVWVLKFYDTDRNFVASSSGFTLNDMGTWSVVINDLPPGTYYAVFKWQSHLASYLSGVQVNVGTGNVFDFTTGSNLYGAQKLNSQTDDGNRYQIAWDLKPVAGDYDHVVNGNDVSIIVTTFPQGWVDALEPRNLNGDTEINSSDIGIIGTNFLQQDEFSVWWLFARQ